MSTELDTTGLTPEEIEALGIDDGDTTATQGELQDQTGTGATTEGDDDEGDDENEGGDDTGAAAAADDGAAAAGKAGDAQPAGAADEQGAAPGTPQAPILVAEAPADADAKLKDIADKKADLRRQYDDGDLTFEEYESQKEALDEERLELKLQIKTAETAAAMEVQRRKNEWDVQCNDFLKAHPEYEGGKGERFEHLNAMLKAIAVMPQNASLTGPQMLEKAHRLALADRGEAPAPAPKADAKPAKAAASKPTLPPDLGAMPAASGNDPTEGKWASLDRLRDAGNGIAYEAALAKMSPADREAYLAA